MVVALLGRLCIRFIFVGWNVGQCATDPVAIAKDTSITSESDMKSVGAGQASAVRWHHWVSGRVGRIVPLKLVAKEHVEQFQKLQPRGKNVDPACV